MRPSEVKHCRACTTLTKVMSSRPDITSLNWAAVSAGLAGALAAVRFTLGLDELRTTMADFGTQLPWLTSVCLTTPWLPGACAAITLVVALSAWVPATPVPPRALGLTAFGFGLTWPAVWLAAMYLPIFTIANSIK